MKKSNSRQKLGFALIATIMMMVLLGILTIGTLSLSAIAVRSTNHDDALGEARANARMALMLAIGELQEHTGPDTRITAPADIIETNAPRLTGVWKSWEGTNHDSTGRPIKPDYTVKNKGEAQSGRFLTWLVSGAESGNNPDDVAPSELVSTSASSGTIALLGEGSLGTNPGQVHVKPQLLEDNEGAYAWWISPENQKARLTTPYEPSNTTAVGWSDLAKSHAVPDPKPFGLENILDDPESFIPDSSDAKPVSLAVSLDTTELIATDANATPQHNFHDMSVTSVGLLTNSATGGWRKDMSILTEKWSDIYTRYSGAQLPLFRILPTNSSTSTSKVPKPVEPPNSTVNATTAAIAASLPDGSLFYPWSNCLTKTYTATAGAGSAGAAPIHGATASWAALVDYATSYKSVTYDTSSKIGTVPINAGQSRLTLRAGGASSSLGAIKTSDVYNFLHKVRKSPVLARIQWIFSVRAQRINPNSATNLFYRVDGLATPVITIWNPYNVAITVSDSYGICIDKSPPAAMAFVKGSTPTGYPDSYFRRLLNGTLNTSSPPNHYDNSISKYSDPNNSHIFTNDDLSSFFPSSFTLAPGEVRVFSAPSGTFTNPGQDMVTGYSGLPSGFTGNGITAVVNFLATDTLKIAMNFDNIISLGNQSDASKQGPGIMLNFGRRRSGGWSSRVVDYCTHYTMMTSLDASTAYWQQPTDLPQPTISSIATDNTSNPAAPTTNPPWTPVFSIVFGPKLTIGSGTNNSANRPTKGLLQSSPFVGATQISSVASATNHPANGAYDFNFFGHANGNSDTIPDNSTSAGYIFSGNSASKGLSRLILSEIPLRPIASLAELQGFDLRAHNTAPPFQYNIIGNSNAVPMIPQDDVVRTDASTASTNLQHDDAYCANHLLFDDWFFSSIAPEPQNFGSSISKTIDVVYREFLKGERRLVNRAYSAIAEDSGLSDADATIRIGQIINSTSGDGWLKVASRLEVDGMFNVNSTSVKAWRALLGHARNKQIAHYSASGITTATGEKDHVVSRYTIASDIEASDDTGMSGSFTGSSQYTGYRILTEAQLDELAENIVEQVRLRGPFLSLAEFVNRQLSDDDDLALAGAIQTALEGLSDDPNEELTTSGYSNNTMASTDSKLSGVGYQFPEASVGKNTFGLPGWIRQADILRPIVPIFSVRDDTFTIRAYGDARDKNGKVIARAWCEATVRRSREFVNTTDSADSIDPPTEQQNVTFGRRYEISRFRWLNANEV